jgi:hypothetical protein
MKKVKRYRQGDIVDVAPDDSGGGGGGSGGVGQTGGSFDAGRQALENAGGINPFAIIGSRPKSDSGPAWAVQKPEDVEYEANALRELRANKALNGGVTTGILRPGLAKGGAVKKMVKGGSSSSRADGCAQRGKTKGRFV